MLIHRSTARNYSETTENRIHSDDVAAGFGFAGGLVPGVAVFGHMTYPLVASLGEDWLCRYRANVRLRLPAYDGDELVIRHTTSGDQHTVLCHARRALSRGARGACPSHEEVLIAELHTDQREPSAGEREGLAPRTKEPTDVAPIAPGAEAAERPEINWGNVFVDEPFPAWHWTPDAIENAEAAAQVEDDHALYRSGVVHPHAILSTANRTFTRRYFLPAWLHVGSEIRFHRLLRVGDTVEVRTVPTAKWERKGHEFVDLRILYLVAGEVATEIVHTSIFKIADRRDQA